MPPSTKGWRESANSSARAAGRFADSQVVWTRRSRRRWSTARSRPAGLVFVDTGLLREGEFESTLALFRKKMRLHVRGVRAEESFLCELRGVTDPEEKRKAIGRSFIRVFEAEAE
jgi:hypothetical protein